MEFGKTFYLYNYVQVKSKLNQKPGRVLKILHFKAYHYLNWNSTGMVLQEKEPQKD